MRDGKVVEEEIFAVNERWYVEHKIVLMLERIQFQNIQVKVDWTDEEFDDGDEAMILIAAK